MIDTMAIVLRREIDGAIEGIESSTGVTNCQAHGSLARGVMTLLRVESAKLEMSREQDVNKKKLWGGVLGRVAAWVITAGAGGLIALWMYHVEFSFK